MKKVVCILTLCVCLIMAGCAPSIKTDLNYFNQEEELNAFYSISPYDQLLPREILDGYTLDGYNWDNLLDSSMDKQRYINLHFCNDEGLKFFVSVRKFVADTIPYSYIADPNDPKTYDVEWYSQQGEHYPKNYSLGGLFYAKDLTSELIEARMGNFVSGVDPSFNVGVLCGDWQVDYTVYLPNENPEIRPVVAQQTYDMITSSLYYTE